MPETLGRPLADTIEEAERSDRKCHDDNVRSVTHFAFKLITQCLRPSTLLPGWPAFSGPSCAKITFVNGTRIGIMCGRRFNWYHFRPPMLNLASKSDRILGTKNLALIWWQMEQKIALTGIW